MNDEQFKEFMEAVEETKQCVRGVWYTLVGILFVIGVYVFACVLR